MTNIGGRIVGSAIGAGNIVNACKETLKYFALFLLLAITVWGFFRLNPPMAVSTPTAMQVTKGNRASTEVPVPKMNDASVINWFEHIMENDCDDPRLMESIRFVVKVGGKEVAHSIERGHEEWDHLSIRTQLESTKEVHVGETATLEITVNALSIFWNTYIRLRCKTREGIIK